MSQLGDVGGVLGAAAGMVSVFIAWKAFRLSAEISREQMAHSEELSLMQDRANHALSRESSAATIYDAYLRCCIEYPQLTSYNVFCNTYGVKTPQKIWEAETKDSEQYLWFVSYLLHACEGILEDASDSEDWLKAIRDQIEYHWAVIEFAWDTHWRGHYSAKLNEQVELVLKKHPRRKRYA